MDAVILGKSYPMAYTVLAQDMIAKQYGSLEAVEQTVSAGGAAAQEQRENLFEFNALKTKIIGNERIARCRRHPGLKISRPSNITRT